MKTRKKSLTIESLLKKEELSYEEYEALEKIMNLYLKAKNKYGLKNESSSSESYSDNYYLVKKKSMIQEVDEEDLYDTWYPQFSRKNESNNASIQRIKDYKEYMDSFNHDENGNIYINRTGGMLVEY